MNRKLLSWSSIHPSIHPYLLTFYPIQQHEETHIYLCILASWAIMHKSVAVVLFVVCLVMDVFRIILAFPWETVVGCLTTRLSNAFSEHSIFSTHTIYWESFATYSLFEEVLALFCLKMTGLMELTGNFDVLSEVAKQSKRATWLFLG